MKIHHIAIWTFQLEEMKEFYTRYFNGSSNEKYINPKKGFESYFLHFDEGTDLELMSRTDIQNTPIEENRLGLTHFAFAFDSQEAVLRRQNGYVQRDIPSQEPGTSGDGYFESVVLDPDGNRIRMCIQGIVSQSEETKLLNSFISSAQSDSSGISKIIEYTVKTHILHKAPEEIHTYQPLADAVVTVYSGAECFLGVIQVYTAQIAETYRCVKLLKHLVILIHYIIACCIRVAGIKANSNARLVIHPVNDMSQLPELISHSCYPCPAVFSMTSPPHRASCPI